MTLEDRVKRWCDEMAGEETEHHIELLVEAEAALRKQRAEIDRLWALLDAGRPARMKAAAQRDAQGHFPGCQEVGCEATRCRKLAPK